MLVKVKDANQVILEVFKSPRRPDNMPRLLKRGTREDLGEVFKILGYEAGVEVGTQRGIFAEALCQRHPDNANYWYAASLSQWSKANYREAVQLMQEALLRRPDELKFLQADAALELLCANSSTAFVSVRRLLPASFAA